MNEERNVLDDLLDNGEDDEDFDAELKAARSNNDRRSRPGNNLQPNKKGHNTKSTFLHQDKKENSKAYNHSGNNSKNNNSAGNGNASRRSLSRESCGSQYSCDSCSCENHSSIHSNRSASSTPGRKSNRSYQSFTRSPSLKFEITKNSDSRTVAKSSPLRDELTSNRKRKHDLYDNVGRDGLKRNKRNVDHVSSSPTPSKKKDKSKRRDYSSLIKYFFKDSCYFVLKSNNEENVEISKREGVWSTPLPNEMKLNSAFKEFRNVILIFSVKESGKFQGFARLSSEAQYDLEPVKWVLPPGIHSCPFGGIFFIDWICRNELSFTKTSHLYNAFNEAKPVKIARDGQEIEPKVGEELCRLFPPDEFVDLIPYLKRMKKQTLNRPRKRHSRGPFMEFDRFENVQTSANRQYRLKPSISTMSLPTNHSVKRRFDYPENFYSSPINRMRDDRYNRLPRRSDSYGMMNGYSTGNNNRYSSDPYGNSDRRYSSFSSTSSSYSTIPQQHQQIYHRGNAYDSRHRYRDGGHRY